MEGSQSLSFQGCLLTKQQWQVGEIVSVSIPFFSGLLTDETGTPWWGRMGTSQSLSFQGCLLTAAALDIDFEQGSQSLSFQGCLLTTDDVF